MSIDGNSRTLPASRHTTNDNVLSEDEFVVKKFVGTIQFKLANQILSPSGIEKKMLRDAIFYPGIYVGSLVGLASFFFLRKAPLLFVNKLIVRNHAASLVKTNSKALQPNPPKRYKEGPYVRAIGTLFDSAVSLTIGGISWVLAIDKKKVFVTAADIPLIEGKSEISDTLCDDFIHLYHDTIPSKFWTENSGDALKTITRFVENCEKRHLYQRRLRMEMGLGNNAEVLIPSRVPEDIVEKERYADWTALEDFDEVFEDNNEDTF